MKDFLGWKNDSNGIVDKIIEVFEEIIEVEKEVDLI